MTIIREDGLAEVLGIKEVDRRLQTWIWLHLCRQVWVPFNGLVNGPDSRRPMADFLREYSTIRDDVRYHIDRGFVPDHALGWIKNEARQCNWLMKHFQRIAGGEWESQAMNSLPEYQDLVGRLDWWPISLNDKLMHLKNAQLAWENQQKRDLVFKWFLDEDEPEKCTMMWEFLCRYAVFPAPNHPSVKSHQELLAFFDAAGLSDDERELKVGKVKALWSQQKYRKNLKGKKQCNLVLKDETIDALDKLAKKHQLTRVQVLEVVLRGEMEKGAYFSDFNRRLALVAGTPVYDADAGSS